MEKAPYLREGDKVVILSTARKITENEITPAVDILRSWGLKVELGKHLFDTYHQFAGQDEERISDFQEALDDSRVRAIFCARGGYGTVRIIDALDFSKFLDAPKWIVGYSDITVLHSHVHQNFNVSTLHATMPINFLDNTEESLQSLKDALFGKELTHLFEGNRLNRWGKGRGELVGGNLSILYGLTGTPSCVTTKGKILFMEDLDEYLYHVDRMLLNLKRAGMLQDLMGLVVGGMTNMRDNAIPYGKGAESIILEAVAMYDYPVCFGFPAGHINDNRALIFGQEVELTVGDKQNRLTFV